MNTVYFKPGADLSFKSVVAMRSKLYQALREDKSGKFGLDLSDVRHCDSAGLALLIEARKLCKKNNKTFEIIGVPAETQSLAEFCGVRGILESK
ncbi:STAS domain-containing protein [Fluoribacter dumoffii]|uniref:Predicted NTP binding protein (Contains STAS domain) n=1 Tax=Fluoribacter dumoffii TaxID=463 RepID=A0A377GAJ0_9GAMM|nr:STAS domain-containing protein [Fluoribacter dumoffii]KTC88665.1 anti-anti-sigma factor [Fluoribacter dumoffii NY 23]MCW8386042.1 STAS domain-containing protein [Fluoribacter dumoffii]MCW8419094.1 STAS domain-containing protein [Fluoribacter dumoffii]MCW8453062.1 STAS domain-containing protein [Fluoribacter dumoffii]MCW8459720.1 STAS domain-containing protein [Fluoribacter dumoffii]